MDEWVLKLEEITLDMMYQLDSADYEHLERFINEREEIINKLTGSRCSPSEIESFRERISKLLAYDKTISAKMQEFIKEAGERLQKINVAGSQKSAYDMKNTVESLFFDKKK